MIKKINHIGIIVRNLDEALVLYEKGIGLKLSHIETAKDCRMAFFPCGEVLVEVFEPTCPSFLMDYLDTHGPGMHHVAYEVTDINEQFNMASEVFSLRDKAPRPGANGSQIFFLDPASIFDAETEFVEMPKD